MKMANMDHVFDYMFTNPKDTHGVKSWNAWHIKSHLWMYAVFIFNIYKCLCVEAPGAR